MTGLTQSVGEFIAGMRFAAMPEAARRVIANGLTDYAGCCLLGRAADVSAIVARGLGEGREARLCFSERRASASDAALLNGTAGHANDYDDIGLGFHPAHPTVALAPAILAEAEVLGASGQDVLTAYVTGYEVWGEIASRDSEPQHVKGWHPSATFGAVAAAAACARLRGLDATRAAHAVGIAASMAGGIVANFGTMTKPFQVGRAASSGVLAARYAAAGMTAGGQALEHRHGLIHALSPGGDVDVETPARFGERWWIIDEGLGLKLYPLCYATHRAVAGMLALLEEKPIATDSISAITVRTSPTRVVPLVHHAPTTALDARFSMEFALSAAVIARRVTLAETTDAFVQRGDVQALLGKVRLDLDPAAARRSFAAEPDDWLIVETADGRQIKRKSRAVADSAASVDPQTLWRKFADCARSAGEDEQVAKLFEALQGIERCGDANDLPVIPCPRFPA